MKYRFAAVLGAAALVSLATHATSTDTTTFLVRITILEGCNIHSTAPTNVDFGANFRGVAVPEAVGALGVLCTAGTPYAIALNNGAHYHSGDGTRRMSDNASNYVAYGLFQSSGTSTPWNATNTKSGTGNGTTQSVPVYGTVPAGATNSAPSGLYSDAVTATITF